MTTRAKWVTVLSLVGIAALTVIVDDVDVAARRTRSQPDAVEPHGGSASSLATQRREVRDLPSSGRSGRREEPEQPRLPDAQELSDDELAALTAEEFKAHALGDRLAQRGEEVRRQRLARDRFEQAVDAGEFAAEQMDQAVMRFFNGIHLEPLLDANGMMEGVAIEEIDEDSPLRDAGFTPGDRLTAINDEALRDPAHVPALLIGLGRDIRLCGEHQGEELCRTVHLD